jgi:hypothetical protein
MEVDKYRFHRRAMMAFHQLSSAEQAQLLERLTYLLALPFDTWSASGIEKLVSGASLYLLRVNDSLRVIFRSAEGQPVEVLDVVRHETLELFAAAGA